MFWLCLAVLSLMSLLRSAQDSSLEFASIELLMPNVSTHQPEAYYCSSLRLDGNTDYYVVGFEPRASGQRVHHLLVFACDDPGGSGRAWPCGLMTLTNVNNNGQPVCRDKSMVMYAWTRHVDRLVLPPGVAFHIGRNTHWRHLVVQVHYAQPTVLSGDRLPDQSGVVVNYSLISRPRLAGVFVLGTGGRILANSREHMEVDCQLDEPGVTLHPFAFRVHTHALGEVVSGYKVERITSTTNNSVSHRWSLLGKMDPQLPQMFYPVTTNISLSQGDILAARCTMYNFRNRTTFVGLTSADEMCNFYVMYWAQNRLPYTNRCGSHGAPRYYWTQHGRLTQVPPHASSLTAAELHQYFQSMAH